MATELATCGRLRFYGHRGSVLDIRGTFAALDDLANTHAWRHEQRGGHQEQANEPDHARSNATNILTHIILRLEWGVDMSFMAGGHSRTIAIGISSV